MKSENKIDKKGKKSAERIFDKTGVDLDDEEAKGATLTKQSTSDRINL